MDLTLPLTNKDHLVSDKSKKISNENLLTIIILGVLTIIYIYLMLSPTQRHVPVKPRHFVIKRQTLKEFNEYMKDYHGSSSYEWSGNNYFTSSSRNYSEWGNEGKADDFFLDGYEPDDNTESRQESSGPIIPSKNFRCLNTWITIRSELNYKYFWMHAENMWMAATATMDTPLQRKAFQIIPVNENCEDGWVRLKEGDTDSFMMMSISSLNDTKADDEWVVKLGTNQLNETLDDYRYHFLLEEEGYVLNRAKPSFLNVMSDSEYTVRGHSSSWDKDSPANREYGSQVHFQMINESDVIESHNKEYKEEQEAIEQDKKYIIDISNYPKSTEKRVISFGLYGNKPKYINGAIRNAELSHIYFPGWVCRYYVTSDVPTEVLDKLKALDSEIEVIPNGMGYSSGMFWRFFVASDDTVDRYIVRDVDSRLNARDR